MVPYLARMGARLLSRLLPTATAAATECCGGGCGYEYRCTQSGAYQRRWCCSQCSCAKSCTAWSTIATGC
jgi:hypothetical protein